MSWVISLAYGIVVLAIAVGFVFGIIWSIEALANRKVCRDRRRPMALMRWLEWKK
jgi:hypothetical protein